jgi:hypothetical protein
MFVNTSFFSAYFGHQQQKCIQIGKIASTKFWDRQTSLERDDLELGASVSQTNNDVKNDLSATADCEAALNINKNVPPLINVCCAKSSFS